MDERQISVLIIEDESTVAKYLQEGLKEVGMHVNYELEGMAGLDRAIRERPDVIMLDLCLPDISGMEVLRKLRAKKVRSKVVVYSGLSDPAIKKKVRVLGATYLQKPFRVEVLIERIEFMADLHRRA
jgi:DNA-binding response OmpR family regulator